MRINICILTIFIVLIATPGVAQKEENKGAIRFHSINQFGVLAGSSDAAIQVQTINGIKNKTGFLGVGVGLDYYYARSIPLFIDVRKNLLTKPATPFIYADGGFNFPWVREYDAQIVWDGVIKTEGGLYYEFGLGYEIPFIKKTGLLISAGYSYKHFSQTVNTRPWLSAWPPPPEAVEKHEYILRRIAVKVGFNF